MKTHPLWRPYEQPTDEEIAAARVLPHESAAVELADPDPAWSHDFESFRDVVVEALGDRALAVRHIGSTSVPGLAAKPCIDIDLMVPDSSCEDDYLADLEAVGFVLRVREPEWEEHRVLRRIDPVTQVQANLHVFSPGAVEPQRHLVFREWLMTHPKDLSAYADLKRGLADEGFTDVMAYNNRKGALIYDIYERIFSADPEHQHAAQPRPAA